MPLKRSYEYVKTIIESKGCQLISSEYNNNKEPLQIIMRCGHENMVRFDLFVAGLKTYMCRSCSENAKCLDNIDSVKQYLINNKCQFISANNIIINRFTEIEYVGKCGHITKSKWNWIKKNSKLQCDMCNHKISDETIVKIVEERKCKLISIEKKYIDTIIKYVASCDCIVVETFLNFKERTHGKCNKCRDKKYTSLNDVDTYLNMLGCKILSTEYKNIYEKIDYIGLCGHKISKELKYIKLGYGLYCNDCISIQSNGEKIISEYFKNNSIKYISQHKFDNCKNINKLPFDFYLPDYNLIIEFDGQDHFKQNGYRGGIDKLKYRQKNDNIKTKFCFDNRIKLVRISYSELKNLNKLLEFIIKYIDIVNVMLIGNEYINMKHYPDKFYEFRCTSSDKLPLFI
ncbi:hypothetical protein QKU48_gp0726 [Fadolivirus algeromassiliense]|jgi:very-short-patch-repair endonuclease|uniref:Uncharacterized protein n=1 Tax=Fadolivirus FV1/VV64 TaxID=3070911 RepID=A0A7D3QVE3_9VIRU|nr:hypothetical protein QKU48_gp0726 [Fadolivirus algeromassiliense]QKF94184.1 hypothetical protein Fadolivirus_1_726 [Fadolivirus FV1/VV64]